MTYEKVYKQGYNINTPINLEFQKIVTQSLRNGLIAYDKRKGWRGPLKNFKYTKNWLEKIEKNFRLEKSIGWQIAIVKKVNQFYAEIETENYLNGTIEYKDISWTKKEFEDLLKEGDVIYVKSINKNFYSLEQLF